MTDPIPFSAWVTAVRRDMHQIAHTVMDRYVPQIDGLPSGDELDRLVKHHAFVVYLTSLDDTGDHPHPPDRWATGPLSGCRVDALARGPSGASIARDDPVILGVPAARQRPGEVRGEDLFDHPAAPAKAQPGVGACSGPRSRRGRRPPNG
jgi:hypothetical protein